MKTTLTTIFSIFLLQTYAQQNYQPGSVKKLNGETVQGWIDYRGWERNPRSVRFKENENGAVSTFTLFDLSSFAITGKESYIKAIVSKDIRPVQKNEITAATQDSTVTDTAFLRVITEGEKLSLYELIDDKSHYYIKDSTGEYRELLYKVYAVDSRGNFAIQTRHIYRDQLRAYLLNDPRSGKFERQLKIVKYHEDELGQLVNAINGNSAAVTSQSRVKTEFFASGGVMHSQLKASGNERLNNLEFSSSTTPTFSVGMDIISKRRLGELALRFEAIYSSQDFTGTSKTTHWTGDQMENEYALKMTNIAPAISFLYSPFRGPSYRVYGGAGLAYTFTSYTRNIYTEVNKSENTTRTTDDFLDYAKSWMSGTACVGGIVKNFEFIFSTRLFGTFETFSLMEIKTNNYSLRAAYRF